MAKLHLTKRTREYITGYAFVAIWVIGFVVLAAIPIFTSLWYSFNIVQIKGSALEYTFNGFKHYVSIFTSHPTYLKALLDYMLKTILYIPIIIVFSLLIALLLNQKIKFRATFRAIFFLPVIIISGPIITELIKSGTTDVPLIEQLGLLDSVNQFLPDFLAGPVSGLLKEFIMILWFSGVQIVLFLAALQKVNKEMYEAAKVDGANGWESFWKITLPALKGIILINVVYSVITLSTVSTEEITTPGVAPATPLGIIKDIMFKNGDFAKEGYGFTSAYAWLYFLTVLATLGILLLFYAFFTRKQRR
jgi:ABC-type sugar transport system permease subunit